MICCSVAIAEVYKDEGNNEYRKGDFNNAIYFYTEGIKVNCKNKELNAKLYSNRSAAHYSLGKSSISSISFPGFSPTRPMGRERERRVSLPLAP